MPDEEVVKVAVHILPDRKSEDAIPNVEGSRIVFVRVNDPNVLGSEELRETFLRGNGHAGELVITSDCRSIVGQVKNLPIETIR
jgi:hypothetical protein